MGRTSRVVAVIGAGPAGLAAAWRAAELGDHPVVFEREQRVGGLCGTVERNGFRFDFGGHRFITGNPGLLGRVCSVGGGCLMERNRRSAIRFRGRFVEYPLQPRNLLTSLGSGFLARSLISKARTREDRDGSFATWASATFGRYLAECFFLPYTEKLWGISPQDLDDDFATARIPGLSLSSAFLSMIGLSPKRTFATRYLYPEGGMGRLFERIATEVCRLGGVIKLGSEVTAIRLGGGQVRSVVHRENGESIETTCDRVIVTAPITDLPHLLPAGTLPNPNLRFRGLRFLNFGFPAKDFSPYTWVYVPEPDIPFTRIQEPRRRSPQNAPAGMSSLMLEIPCDPGSDTWNAPDSDLYEASRLILDRFAHEEGRDPLPPPVLLFSVRTRHAYPLLERGYRTKLDSFLREASRISGLGIAGRQASFRYIFMDAAMLQGMNVAESASSEPPEVTGLVESRNLLG